MQEQTADTALVSAFRWVPPIAHGYVKDLRVRWAHEEAGLPYQAVLIDRQAQTSPDYRQWQPFGQVPAYREGELELFESGAIVLHVARKSQALSPADEAGHARTTAWVIAALNSIEPFAVAYVHFTASRAQIEPILNRQLSALSDWLGGKDYLEGGFTAGDLVMTTVLRDLVDSGVLARYPILDAYRRRCEGRPAFGRALEAQLKVFRDNAPAPQAAND